MNQRGFGVWLYLVLALAVLAAIGGLYAAGYSAGKDSKQAQWDEANRAAQAAADAERRKREAAARAASEALQRAQRDASTYRARWNAERAKQPVLATCGPAEPAGPGATVVVRTDAAEQPAAGGLRLTLTREFIRLYDGAWTGQDGQPVFGDPGRPAGETSTADPARLLAVHEENATRCSATSRQLNALIDLIEKLRSQ